MTSAERRQPLPSRARWSFGAVLGLAVVVFAGPIGRAPIWEPNDARYVLLARDMVERGHWLVPEIRGVPTEGLFKPQLYSWSIALASLHSGEVTAVTASLPSVVSALAGVAGVFAVGSLLWSVPAGALAGLILTTAPNYVVFAHHSLADVMMTAFMVWALYFLLRARSGDLRPLLAFYVCVGAAMLSKGPPGLAALVAAAVATGLASGRPALARLRPAVGAVVLAVLAIPWVVPYLLVARSTFVRLVVVGEYWRWFLGPHNLAYRLWHMPAVLLYFVPWTLFLPAVVVWWRRSDQDDGRRYVLWWTVTLWVLAGMSGKYRARYFLPVYPGLALLTGECLARAAWRAVRREVWLGVGAFVVVTVVVLAALASSVTLPGEGSVYLPDVAWERTLIGCVAAVGALAAVLAARRGSLVGVGGLIALSLAVIFAIEGHTSALRRTRRYDVPTLGAVAMAQTPPDGVVVGYPDLSLEYDVYIRRDIAEITSRDEMLRLFGSPTKDTVIMTRQRWVSLGDSVAPGWHVLASRMVGARDIVVIGRSSR